jgi:hypothetical protein
MVKSAVRSAIGRPKRSKKTPLLGRLVVKIDQSKE